MKKLSLLLLALCLCACQVQQPKASSSKMACDASEEKKECSTKAMSLS